MAYSVDFRRRVVEMVRGGMSKMQAHKSFGVSRSTLDDWLDLEEATGDVQPSQARRGRQPSISDLTAFEAFARRHQGNTLAQMACAWEKETGVRLTVMPFSQALKRIGWTRKKRVFCIKSGASQNEKALPGS